MATQTRLVFISLGVATTASPTVTIFESGQTGEVGSRRVLTHPDGVNFAPITYYLNPSRTFNLDNGVIPSPDAEAILTLGSRPVVRFERALGDTIITEVWEGAENARASMPTFFFRWFYEYLINPPVFSSQFQTYLKWEPRDRTLLAYNVILFQIRVGSGSKGEQVFDVDDFRVPVGVEVKTPLESFDVAPTGLITRDVTLKFRVVSLAT